MNCPSCKNAMIVLELEQVEIDHCIACGGIWLDSGELKLLLEDTSQSEKFIDSFEKVKFSNKRSRSCPICLKKMDEILVGSHNKPVVIDRCPKSHGLWFDKGELQNILSKANLDKNQKIVKLLSQMFNYESEVKNGG